jgi:alcohol dehydrogenase class IV
MFSFISPQAIHFGRGQRSRAAHLAAAYGPGAVLVHGSDATRAQWLLRDCAAAGLRVRTVHCHTEPALPDLEAAVQSLRAAPPDVVIALGGGSVMDFAKALAALLPCAQPVVAYLEGGAGAAAPLEHPPLPVIALPTTAGTGAEVTKNAVILIPERGVKVSLRDPRMVPAVSIVDPDLMQGAPRAVVLGAALDAITQVIEPYLCATPNPMTDALCSAAIAGGVPALRGLVEHGSAAAWDTVAWVSTCGGLALANAGLGAVHGFAGVIGGRTRAPHGEICGALLPAVLHAHLRHARAGTDIHDRLMFVQGHIDAAFGGIGGLERWARAQGLRSLGQMGLREQDHDAVVAAAATASSMKGNPFVLSPGDLLEILRAAA